MVASIKEKAAARGVDGEAGIEDKTDQLTNELDISNRALLR